MLMILLGLIPTLVLYYMSAKAKSWYVPPPKPFWMKRERCKNA